MSIDLSFLYSDTSISRLNDSTYSAGATLITSLIRSLYSGAESAIWISTPIRY